MSPTIKRIRLSYKKKAKQKCLFFNNAKTRKRIYINALATHILRELITSPELTINEGEAYSDNFFLAESFDISDIKVNNINIDTRCIINNEFTQLWIPKKPYEFGFIFDFYVAITINTTSDKAEIVGYVTHEDIKDNLKTNTDKINYYIFDVEKLRPIENFENDVIELSKVKPEPATYKQSDHEIIQEMFVAFLDNQLSAKEKTFFNNHIKQCDTCREELLYLHLFDTKIKSQRNTRIFIDANAVSMDEPVLEAVKEYTPVEPARKSEEPIIEEKYEKPALKKIEALQEFETDLEEIPEETTFEEIKPLRPFDETEEFEEETVSEEELFTPFDTDEEHEVISEEIILEEISKEPILEEDDTFAPFEETEEFETISEETVFEEIAEEPVIEEDTFTPFEETEEFETISEETVFEEIAEEPVIEEDTFAPFEETEELETISEETVFEEIAEEPVIEEDTFAPFEETEEFETISEETVFEEIAEEPVIEEDTFAPFEETKEFETISEETVFEKIAEEPAIEEDTFAPFEETEEFETISEETIFEEIAEEPVIEEDTFTPFDETEAFETVSTFEEAPEETTIEEETFTPFDATEEFNAFTPFDTIEAPSLEDSFELITPNEVDLSDEENLLAEAKAAESFLDNRLTEAGIDELQSDIESTQEEVFEFEEELTYQTPEEPEVIEEPVVPFEEPETSIIEEDPFLTLENLEEEHVETLHTFDDSIDLESIEKSTTIAETSFESDFSDFTSFHEETTITSEPETISFEPEPFVTDSFGFDEPKEEIIDDTPEETDAKLEDLEEEFNTLASFNFEEEPVIGIEPIETITEEPIETITEEIIEPETYVPEAIELQTLPEDMFEEHGADISTIEIEDTTIEDKSIGIEAEDMFEVPEGLENMFDAPTESPEIAAEVDDFVTIGDEEVLFEEIPEFEQTSTETESSDIEYTPVEYTPLNTATAAESSTTIEDQVDYMPAENLQEQVDQLEEELEQQQQEIAAIDESTESAVPTDTEIADLKEFAEKKKDSATSEVKKAKKSHKKKFVLLAASLLLIGTVTAGVIIIAPSLSGISNRMLTSLPMESSADKLKRQLALPDEQLKKEAERNQAQAEAVDKSKEVTPHEIEEIQPPDTKKLLAGDIAEGEKPVNNEATVGSSTPDIKDIKKTEPASSEPKQEAAPLPPAPAPKAKPAEEPKPVEHKVAAQPAPAKKAEPKAAPAVVAKEEPKAAPKAVAKPKTRKPVNVPPQRKRTKTKQKSTSQNRMIAYNKPAPKPVVKQNKDTIRKEDQESASFLPKKRSQGLNDSYDTIQADADTNTIAYGEKEAASSFGAGRSTKAMAPTNGLLAGLTEKKESIKQSLNPDAPAIASVSYITNANVYWKPTSSKRIENALKSFINTSTQKAKSAINASLKNNNISGQHTPTVIIIKINNSTNSIIATIGSTSGSSRVDNLILNAVRKSFSAGSLPKSDNNSDIIKFKLIVALQH